MTIVLALFTLLSIATPWLYRRLGTSTFYLLAAVPAGVLALVLSKTRQILGGTPWSESYQWIPELDMALTFRMDTLAWIMSLLVLGVGSLVLFYCASYFKHSTGDNGQFAAYLFGFAGAMFGLITADDFILMFIFWEITTILSYLLIGYSRHRLTARRSALQALTLTTAGGLAMLVGIVMLGYSLGTYSLTELVERGPDVLAAAQAGTGELSYGLLSVALVLILCGALSKSAIFPLHFWLPGAMAAPTPVSAYLHAAAMVKAGIYILLRLAPGFGDVAIWQNVLVIFGAFTMVFGGWSALKQTDLKLILAYGTVSQLGFLTLVISGGTPDALYAAMALMVAHSLFKATLFLSVGIIDHQSGTRDIHKLSGIYRRAPKLATVATISAASMAGIPPLAGFVAKEAVLETYLTPNGGWQGGTALAAIIIGSVLTFAYSARFVWGAFAVKPYAYMHKEGVKYCQDARTPAVLTSGEKLDTGVLNQVLPRSRRGVKLSPDTAFHPVSWNFLFAPALLTALTLVYGLYPEPVHLFVEPALEVFPATAPDLHLHLALWHGVTPALLTSLAIMAVGVLLFVFRKHIEELQLALPSFRSASVVYRDLIDGLDRLAVWVTGMTQRGSLGFYLGVILITAVVVPFAALFINETPPLANVRVSESPAQWSIAVVMIVAALVVVFVRKRFLAIMMVSVTGYGMAILFALRSAPDLATTQLLVETIVLVAFVLAMRVLPRQIPRIRSKDGKGGAHKTLRIIIALGFAALMMALAMFTFSSRSLAPISLDMPRLAYEIGHGYNVVNVTLVDMRGWDTFGEISVLALAATGVASLLFIEGRADSGSARRLDTQAMKKIELSFAKRTQITVAQRVAGRFSSVERDPFIVAGRTLPPESRSILLEVMTRLLFHTLIMVSFYMLIAGHNLPGGGFAGGLMVGLAFAVRYLAGGGAELRAASPVSAGTFLGAGLGIATLYALAPALWGDPIFSSYVIDFWLPVFGDVHFVTATIFDIGVYLLVIGLVLDILRSLGERIDQKLIAERRKKEKQARDKARKA
ncbi:Na+/H+ antiporter subunit A [Rothia nasimurium]|uniref:Na+/H+ antiporter subunit A n=1 Tax=Rothia nasimurium TaxID=85336 RepID=UPI001F3EA2D9|nr:Na+/H+ antiporter subunit A [Rothia nasimurium]